jgi:hypothetical protein
MVEPYRPQIAPQRTMATTPMADARDFGGGLVDVISGVGQQLERRQVRQVEIETARERDRQQSDAMARLAAMVGELETFENEARQTSDVLGAGGHSTQMEREFDRRATEFLDSITDDQVRERMRVQVAVRRAPFVAGADAYERATAVRAIADNVAIAGESYAMTVSRAATPEDYELQRTAFREQIAGLSIDATLRARLERQYLQQGDVAWLAGRPPQERLALVGSGLFDSRISPAQAEVLRNGAEADIRRLQMEAEARARLAVASAREEIDAVQREANDGIPISDERLARAAELAQANGLSGEAYDIGRLTIINRTNREFQSATPLQIEQSLRGLDADIAQAGDRVNPALVIRRNHLRTLLTARSEQVDSDPAAYGAQMGIRFDPIDTSNPESVNARMRAARIVAADTGRPPAYLTAQEVEQVRANMGTPDGRRTALGLARSFRRYDPQASRQVAQQIAPNDPLFVHAAALPPQIGDTVLEGRALLNRSFRPPNGLDAQIAQQAGAALRRMPGIARNNVIAATRAIYAYYASRDGVPDGPGARISQGLIENALRMATGGERRNGVWHGGIGEYRGRQVLLPQELNEAQFEAAMARISDTGLFTRAGDEVSGESLRRNYTPVRLANGRYGFAGPDGAFLTERGRQGVPGDIDIMRFVR